MSMDIDTINYSTTVSTTYNSIDVTAFSNKHTITITIGNKYTVSITMLSLYSCYK